MPDDIRRFLDSATARLAESGMGAPRREARLLLAEALGETESAVFAHPERLLAAQEALRAEALLERRLSGEPLSRIRGRREFWSLSFEIGPATLDPRPDSEVLIETLLAWMTDRQAALSFLDFGTGSGCLLLALLSEFPNATGLGIDCQEEALATARRNAQALGLAERASFQPGDWGEGLEGSFDVVLSNPPYIESAEIEGLEEAVRRYDPLTALDGGADGLEAYRRLIPDAARLLKPNGLLALEIGWRQAEAVSALLEGAGFSRLCVAQDLGGRDRCLLARHKPG